MKKLIALLLAFATIFATLVVPVSAADNTSKYAVKITSPKDGDEHILGDDLYIKWKSYSKAGHYWVALKFEDGSYVYNGIVKGTSLRIKGNKLEEGEYKLFVEARDKNGERMHQQSAWQVFYFDVVEDEPEGLLSEFPELMLDHGRYYCVDELTYYSMVDEDEYVPADKKLRLEFNISDDNNIDYVQVFVKLLYDEPDPESYCEEGELLYDKEVSVRKGYLDVSRSNMDDADQHWLKVSLQGCSDDGKAYTTIRNYYIWVGDSDEDEDTFASTYPTTDESGNQYTEYSGVDYLSTLYALYRDGVIDETEYHNRVQVCEEARKMASLKWISPVDFHTWKGGDDLKYNANGSMHYLGSRRSVREFIEGSTYIGIPYSASLGKNILGVQEWMAKVNTATKRADLEGDVIFDGILRTECTLYGIDCSGFVYQAYSDLNKPAPHLSTSAMLGDSRWKKLSSLTDLLPGDILLKDGHVMIFVGKNDNGNFAVFESVADGYNGYSGCRYFTHGDVGKYQPYRYRFIAE